MANDSDELTLVLKDAAAFYRRPLFEIFGGNFSPPATGRNGLNGQNRNGHNLGPVAQLVRARA